jgi:hypothetical protein
VRSGSGLLILIVRQTELQSQPGSALVAEPAVRYYNKRETQSAAEPVPAGWRDRIIMFDMPEALPSRARCLDQYDLDVSKLVAQREKDIRFAVALIGADLISHAVLQERAGLLDDPVIRERVLEVVEALRAEPVTAMYGTRLRTSCRHITTQCGRGSIPDPPSVRNAAAIASESSPKPSLQRP